MRIGVMLPNFEESPTPAIDFAIEAEAVGLDGVFSYDHLWPMAHPGLPSLSPMPLLAAAGAHTTRLRLGTLVARIGLEPDDVVVAAFRTLELMSGSRVIAAMGTGDHKSDDENVAFGLNLVAATVRRGALEAAAARLIGLGIETWIGGGGRATNDVAVRLGCPVNFWAGGEEVTDRLRREPRATWGGQLPPGRIAAVERLRAIRDAGAEWAVLSWQEPLEVLVTLLDQAEIGLEADRR